MKRTLLALSLLTAAALPAQKAKSPLDGFDAYVARAMRDWKVPGLSIAVVKDDSVVFLKGYGVRELGKPDPVTEHTKFGIMSTSKAFTAMLAAMLADSGKVAFDDPVTKYVPSLQLADPYVTRELTLRDLLTHRVGFPDPYYLWDSQSWGFDEITHRLRLVRPASSFRSRFAYNNVGYALAGEVDARAGGASWQQLLHRRILEPLGMAETFADGRELREKGVTDVAAPHGLVDDTVRVLAPNESVVDPVAPAGAIFSTASDMSKWLRFLLDSGTLGGPNGKRLVSQANFAQLWTAQAIVPPEEFYPTARLTHPHVTAYGLAWFLEDYRGQYVAFHTGSIEGRAAIVGLIPDRKLGVVILENLDHAELRHALMYTVFDRFIGGTGPEARHDWSAEMLTMYTGLADAAKRHAREQEGKRVADTKPTLPLPKYAGIYSDSLFGDAAVRLENGALTLQVGGLTGTLEHWNYDTFRVRWRDPFLGTDFVAFSIDPDGTVGEIRMVDGPQHYRRVNGNVGP